MHSIDRSTDGWGLVNETAASLVNLWSLGLIENQCTQPAVPFLCTLVFKPCFFVPIAPGLQGTSIVLSSLCPHRHITSYHTSSDVESNERERERIITDPLNVVDTVKQHCCLCFLASHRARSLSMHALAKRRPCRCFLRVSPTAIRSTRSQSMFVSHSIPSISRFVI